MLSAPSSVSCWVALSLTPRSKPVLQRVLDWCADRGIAVEFGAHRDSYEIATRTIYIRAGQSPFCTLTGLLHECGHALLDRTRAQRWPHGYASPRPRGLKHSIEVLLEECEAWHRGERLAQRLGVKLDVRRYRRMRDACLADYARGC